MVYVVILFYFLASCKFFRLFNGKKVIFVLNLFLSLVITYKKIFDPNSNIPIDPLELRKYLYKTEM